MMDKEYARLMKVYAEKYQAWEVVWRRHNHENAEELNMLKTELLHAQSDLIKYGKTLPKSRFRGRYIHLKSKFGANFLNDF